MPKKTVGITEYPFSYETYLEEQLKKIEDIDERKFAKTVILDCLLESIRHMEDKYQQLEQRVYQELDVPQNRYGISITVVEKQQYDPTNETLFPICPEDLEVRLPENELVPDTVYLKMSETQIRDLIIGKEFSGYLEHDGQKRNAMFMLKPSIRYREKITQLYQMFLDNQISWNTVNLAHLNKFYDVEVSRVEAGTQPQAEAAEWMRPGFGELENLVKKDYIPLWNLEPVEFAAAYFMVPAIDQKYYEHEFKVDNRQDGFLIESEQEILEIRHEQDKIILKLSNDSFDKFSALRVVQPKDGPVKSYRYQEAILHNHRKDHFLRRLSKKTFRPLFTKADLLRRIDELDIGEYLEIQDIELLENEERQPLPQSMNWFMARELFAVSGQKVIMLVFAQKQPGYYLNDAVMQYAVSELQLDFHEYQCMGRLL